MKKKTKQTREELLSKRKEYREKNREKLKEKKREYNSKPEVKKMKSEYGKKYCKENKDKIKKYKKENKERIKAYAKKYYHSNKKALMKYREENKEKTNKWLREYRKKKRLLDKEYNIIGRLRSSFYLALKNYTLSGKTKSSNKYGIDYKKIIEHLKPFPKEISKYEIDHIKPLCSFKFINKDGTTNLEEVKKSFAPENLQWLTIKENRTKGASTQ